MAASEDPTGGEADASPPGDPAKESAAEAEPTQRIQPDAAGQESAESAPSEKSAEKPEKPGRGGFVGAIRSTLGGTPKASKDDESTTDSESAAAGESAEPGDDKAASDSPPAFTPGRASVPKAGTTGADASSDPDPTTRIPSTAEDTDTSLLIGEVAGLSTQVGTLSDELAAARADLTELAALRAEVPAALEELRRLRTRDADLVDKLHADNTRLREGELAKVLGPLLSGLIRLHDQMGQLAGDDKASDAALLRKQLLQVLDASAGVTPYEPAAGDAFDTKSQVGAGRRKTGDKDADGRVARTVRAGFRRLDGSIVRPAEVEVSLYDPDTPAALTNAPAD